MRRKDLVRKGLTVLQKMSEKERTKEAICIVVQKHKVGVSGTVKGEILLHIYIKHFLL